MRAECIPHATHVVVGDQLVAWPEDARRPDDERLQRARRHGCQHGLLRLVLGHRVLVKVVGRVRHVLVHALQHLCVTVNHHRGARGVHQALDPCAAVNPPPASERTANRVQCTPG